MYRWVLRQYLGYLVEKRFTLEWYIEGTRSRIGKLGPPKMGLLRYIVDAVREGRARRRRDGAGLDRLRRAPRGRRVRRRGTRRAQGDGSRLAWMVRNFRAQRRHRGGRIYVRFGEPLSLRAAVHPDATAEEADLELQKLAFEVATRINAVTPITAPSLVSIVLSATDGKALTAGELHRAARPVPRPDPRPRASRSPRRRSRSTPSTASRPCSTRSRTTARSTCTTAAPRRCTAITSGQSHAAAFYRNTILHHFVPARSPSSRWCSASECRTATASTRSGTRPTDCATC